MAVSLSCAWNAFRHNDGYNMLFEIKELGFPEVELSFNLTISMLAGVERAVKEGLIKVSSIHNTCPIPEGLSRQEALPDYYPMSSLDEEKRRLAVKYAKRSIDTASALGAKAVVLHCGRLEIPDRTRYLIELYSQNQNNSEEFIAIRNSLIQERNRLADNFLENTLKSLDEISRYAVSKEILLGMENRFYYREIPSFAEIGIILERYKNSNVLYWHDTGHAKIMNTLGLAPDQEDFLKSYKDSLLGVHLHDVRGCQDHLPPSQGTLDFSIMKRYCSADTLKVIEAHHPASAEDIKKGRDFITALFYESE